MANTRCALRTLRCGCANPPIQDKAANFGAAPAAISGRRVAVNGKRTQMSERLETLKKARERMVDDRDAFAKTLAAPFDRDKAERARLKFVEIQGLIDAIDRAIAGEQPRPSS